MRKLLGVAILALALYFIAFAGGFFAMGIARAEEPREVPAEATGEHTEATGEHGGEAGHHLQDPSKFFTFFGSPGEHYGKDMMGGKLGDGTMTDPEGKTYEEEPKSPPFIWLVLNFVLLLVILAKWGKPPIEKLAADRHDQIKTALEEAAKLRTQAAEKLAEYETKLKAADSEITKMVEGMRADAESDKKRILEAAERQAVQMKRDAEQRIAAEIETARAALTREVTAASVAATEKLLREKMTPADQQTVVTSFITSVESSAKEAR